MRRFSLKPYFLTALFLFLVLSLPPKQVNRLRVRSIEGISNHWQTLQMLKAGFSLHLKKTSPNLQHDLEVENAALKKNMELMREWMLEETRLMDLYEKANQLLSDHPLDKGFIERRQKEALRLMQLETHAVIGKVIYRDPALWSSFIWLNVGEATNQQLGKKVIGKNSPVLSRGYLVGIVEEVFENTCKVRLITDKRLNPAVRAYRGEEQEAFHEENIDILLSYLADKGSLFASSTEAEKFFSLLKKIKKELKSSSFSSLLAKGELYGMSKPLWKLGDTELEGIGFNYDFADEEGPAHNLRTGEILPAKERGEPILNVGDLLVTSGLDGVFPAGLKVAVVTKIFPLHEGACSYTIRAKACETAIHSIETATVIPPLDIEECALPLKTGRK